MSASVAVGGRDADAIGPSDGLVAHTYLQLCLLEAAFADY